MQITQNQLPNYLTKINHNNIPRFFWLNSEDNYLLQDCAKQIKTTLKPLDYSNNNKIIFHIDNSTDWSVITNTLQTKDLFTSNQLIEICFINKITPEQQQNLIKIAELLQSNTYTVIIIYYPFRIESKVLKQKWMLHLNKIIDNQSHKQQGQLRQLGFIITIWSLSTIDYPKWLSKQLQKYQLSLEHKDLFDYFCQKTMCNPNMANQILYKLKLIYSPELKIITQDILLAMLDQHANYNIFDFIDNYLLGNIKQSLIILKILKQNDLEPLLILGLLRKELTTLANIYEQAAATKQPLNQILKNLNLWQNKTNILAIALKNLNLKLIYKQLNKIAEIEPLVKTVNNHDLIWQQINELLLLNIVSFEPDNSLSPINFH